MLPQRKRRSQLIERALKRALQSVDGSPKILDEAMRYCVFSGGKRFRPLLCLGGCEAVGGEAPQALSVACSIELIHTYSLVHDDLPAMDDADERRGRPSCHRKFGEAMAVLVGDALLTRAFELLSRNGTPNALMILRTISEASGTGGLIGGQVLDLECGMRPPRQACSAGRGNAARPGKRFARRAGECGIKKLEETARKKTAALIAASVVAGGLAGGASFASLKTLRRFGDCLGLAFQLKDDVHDADGLVPVLGRARVERRARALIDEAQRTMKPFGGRARLLRELSDWLIHS